MESDRWQLYLLHKEKDRGDKKKQQETNHCPTDDKLKDSIKHVGNEDSPFFLGKIDEGYDENQFKDRSKKVRKQINRKLRDIRDNLKLSQPLILGAARDCYANTLDKNETNIKKISQMLGHSNVVVTEHYLSGLNPDETFGINDPIL